VISVSSAQALTLLGDSLLYVVLPLHAAALGLSGWQVGVLLSGNRFVRMATNSGASWLMRRFPPGPPFTAATALAAVTTALYTLTPQFLPFLLARFLWGLCFSTLRLGCFLTVLAEATERTRGRLMGLYRSTYRAGSFVSVVAGGAIFDAYGYRVAMLAMAGGTALAVPLALWGGPSTAEETLKGRLDAAEHVDSVGRAERRPWWSSLRPRVPQIRLGLPSPVLAVNWSAFALAFVARGVVTATLALFIERAFGDRFGPGGAIGVATVGSWLIGVRWLSEIGLATPLGALSDRVGRMRSAVAWTSAATVALVALAAAPSLGVAVAAAVALFVAASGLGSTLDAAAGDLAPPERRAQVMSSYADWSDLGAAFGPLLALTLADAIGLRPSYALGAGFMALGAVGLLVAFRGQSAFLRRQGAKDRQERQGF
jgi:MFS family permease